MLINTSCGESSQQKGKGKMAGDEGLQVRYPAVAGQFYTNDPKVLRKEIEGFLEKAEYFPHLEPFAIVAPHAGYVYSGWIAGYSYRQVMDKDYETVVVISPSHVDWFDFSAVMAAGYYRTPLGDIPVDENLAMEICGESAKVSASLKGHFSERGGRGEHALEVQLPFLQVALNKFKLVPIVMGNQSYENCRELGEALAGAIAGKRVLIVASSDLSHFHEYEEANRLDQNFIELLESFDPEKICSELALKKVEACGGGPIAAAMIAGELLGAEGIKVIKHANSGDVQYGSKDQVVGYLAAVVYKNGESEDIDESAFETQTYGLSLSEKRQLMDIAKSTVEAVVAGKSVEKFKPITKRLEENRGAFVTLKIKGQLRGCIGYIVAMKPLYLTVQDVAESAALRDPRFKPVSLNELSLLDYEISALSPVRVIDNVEDIEVGKHGVIIKQGYNQGLLLPQVATEYGWDRETFLEQTCRKAGLPIDAWKDSRTEISIFSAEVFDEEEIR